MQTPFPSQDQFVDLFRNGMKAASDIAQASLNSSLKLQSKQLDMVRGMIEENARSTEKLAEARSMEELWSVQQRLAGAQMQRMAEYWTTLWQTAAEGQQTLFTQVRSQAGQAAEFATRSAEDVARAAANQVSRASGSVRESAANHHKPEHRRPA
jgi:hypothetical protein